MKKLLSLLLCVLLVCAASVAFADYKAGDTVTISVSVSNPNDACAFDVGFSYDKSALQFVSASGASGVAGGKNGFFFAAMSPFSGGSIGTATFKVTSNAVPGKTYTISCYSMEARDYDDNVVSIGVSTSGGSVTIASAGCTEHKWDAGKTTKEPGCESEGVKTYTCQNDGCTQTKTEAIPATGHAYTDKITPATCTKDGVKTSTCSGCGDVKTEIITATGHSYGEAVVEPEATCTTEGKKTSTCTACGDVKTEVIPAAGHKPSTTPVRVEPTCEEDGSLTIYCINCPEAMQVTVLDATGHKLDDGVETTAPTCEEEGVKTFTCQNCDYTETEAIPATGHDYDDGVETTAPTCEEEGVKTFTCKNDATHTKTEAIDAIGHDYDEGVVTTQPTCKDEGVKTFTCKNDATHTKTEPVPVTEDHKWDAGVEKPAPTCTEEGTLLSTCTVCGETKEDVIPAKGHSYDEGVETKAPTCEEDGVKTFTCQNDKCGHTYTEAIDAIGHDYDEGVVTTEPTCKDEGVKTFTCKNDATHTKTESVPVTEDHKWDAGVEKPAPTCTEEGVLVTTCTVCGKTTEETIPAKGHSKPDQAVIVPPTCTEDGSATYECTVCGTEIEGEVIPATGHSYDEGVETKAPTCEEEGEKLFTCQNEGCDHTYTETVDAIGHDYDEGIETTAPTCEEDGVKTFTCQNDASHTYTEAIPATGHTGEWIVSRPPTEDAPGEKYRVCECCGETEYQEIPNFTLYRMTVSSIGPRFRDVRDDLDVWNMFTAIDLSVEGEQTFELVAGNMHVIGEVTVLVEDGYVTVTYKLYNEPKITMETEFMTFLATLNDVTTTDPEQLTGFAFGEPISIADQLGGDTKVLLYINNSCYYTDNISGIHDFADNKDYEALVEAQMALMD